MITLNLKRDRKVRIWLRELPEELSYAPTQTIEPTLEAKSKIPIGATKAAVEMLVPSAGRALYGLLGAQFVSDRSGQLIVKVALCEQTEKEVNWSLAAGIDRVMVGLPGEYASRILDGAVGAGEILGSGVLSFNCAAHGEIGSSPRIFRQLASIVVRLLASQEEALSEEELVALVSASGLLNDRSLAFAL